MSGLRNPTACGGGWFELEGGGGDCGVMLEERLDANMQRLTVAICNNFREYSPHCLILDFGQGSILSSTLRFSIDCQCHFDESNARIDELHIIDKTSRQDGSCTPGNTIQKYVLNINRTSLATIASPYSRLD